MNISSAVLFDNRQEQGLNIWRIGSSSVDESIEQIEYLLRNGSNQQGVQRDLEEIVPEIEALLEELKEAIKEERRKAHEGKGEERKY